MLSAIAGENIALTAGADVFLRKPEDINEIVEAAKSLLKESQ
jgi:DNA-binding response OmpR family regulator